jgi:hypothetical protein
MSKAANKGAVLIFRLSPHDRISVISKARRAKISVSDFCRKAVTGAEVKHIEGLSGIVYELNKIGTNINQIAVAANQGRDTSKTISAIQARLSETLENIDRAIGGDSGSDSQTD